MTKALFLILGGWLALAIHPSLAEAQQFCGGIAGRLCPEGSYCDYGKGSCGIADAAGVCRTLPRCANRRDPVCGCDGVTYRNVCQAAAAGASVNHEGRCTRPKG